MRVTRGGLGRCVLALASHPFVHVAMIAVLVFTKLTPLGAHLDLPNNDQIGYLEAGTVVVEQWRFQAKTPLYAGYMGLLAGLSGAGPEGLFVLEKRVTTALFCGSLYLALSSVVPSLVAFLVSVHFLNLRYILEETNGNNLFGVCLYLLAIASVGLKGRRGAPLALALLTLSALARLEMWLVVVFAGPVLLGWYARRRGEIWRLKEPFAWFPVLGVTVLACGLWLRSTGPWYPLRDVFRLAIMANMVDHVAGFSHYLAWNDALIVKPELFHPEVGILDILVRYPGIVARHVAINLVLLPRSVAAIMIKYGSLSHFLVFWALAAVMLVLTQLIGRNSGSLQPTEARSAGPGRMILFLAGLGVLPVLFMLLFLSTAIRYLFVLVPLQALLIAKVVCGVEAILLSRLDRGEAKNKLGFRGAGWPMTVVVWLFFAIYVVLPFGPLTGLPSAGQPHRAIVANASPHIRAGSLLASDAAEVVCLFGPRCRPISLNSQTMWDPLAWERLGAENVIWSFRVLGKLRSPEDKAQVTALAIEQGWRVVVDGAWGMLLTRSGA